MNCALKRPCGFTLESGTEDHRSCCQQLCIVNIKSRFPRLNGSCKPSALLNHGEIASPAPALLKLQHKNANVDASVQTGSHVLLVFGRTNFSAALHFADTHKCALNPRVRSEKGLN